MELKRNVRTNAVAGCFADGLTGGDRQAKTNARIALVTFGSARRIIGGQDAAALATLVAPRRALSRLRSRPIFAAIEHHGKLETLRSAPTMTSDALHEAVLVANPSREHSTTTTGRRGRSPPITATSYASACTHSLPG